MFSHAQFLLIKHKNIFECFILFLESFLFLQKYQKPVLPCFGDLITGLASRMPQLRACSEGFHDSLAGQSPSHEKYLENFSKSGFLSSSWLSLATCSQVEVPVARVLRDFRGLPRDSLAGRISSREKHLEKFSKFCL